MSSSGRQSCADKGPAALLAPTPLSDGACGCVAELDAKLAEHNAALVTTMFGKPPRVLIETYKVHSGKRGKAPRVLATYCPFCGEKYAREAAQ